jgi:hypothetical protein
MAIATNSNARYSIEKRYALLADGRLVFCMRIPLLPTKRSPRIIAAIA